MPDTATIFMKTTLIVTGMTLSQIAKRIIIETDL